MTIDLQSILNFARDAYESHSPLDPAMAAIIQAIQEDSDEPLEAYAVIHLNAGQS